MTASVQGNKPKHTRVKMNAFFADFNHSSLAIQFLKTWVCWHCLLPLHCQKSVKRLFQSEMIRPLSEKKVLLTFDVVLLFHYTWPSPTKSALTRILVILRCATFLKMSESADYFVIWMKVVVQKVWKFWPFEVAKCYERPFWSNGLKAFSPR